jgi:hypothetical protein
MRLKANLKLEPRGSGPGEGCGLRLALAVQFVIAVLLFKFIMIHIEGGSRHHIYDALKFTIKLSGRDDV